MFTDLVCRQLWLDFRAWCHFDWPWPSCKITLSWKLPLCLLVVDCERRWQQGTFVSVVNMDPGLFEHIFSCCGWCSGCCWFVHRVCKTRKVMVIFFRIWKSPKIWRFEKAMEHKIKIQGPEKSWNLYFMLSDCKALEFWNILQRTIPPGKWGEKSLDLLCEIFYLKIVCKVTNFTFDQPIEKKSLMVELAELEKSSNLMNEELYKACSKDL